MTMSHIYHPLLIRSLVDAGVTAIFDVQDFQCRDNTYDDHTNEKRGSLVSKGQLIRTQLLFSGCKDFYQPLQFFRCYPNPCRLPDSLQQGHIPPVNQKHNILLRKPGRQLVPATQVPRGHLQDLSNAGQGFGGRGMAAHDPAHGSPGEAGSTAELSECNIPFIK